MTYDEALQREIDATVTRAELRCVRDGGTVDEARVAGQEVRDRLARQVAEAASQPMSEALRSRLSTFASPPSGEPPPIMIWIPGPITFEQGPGRGEVRPETWDLVRETMRQHLHMVRF